MFGLGVALMSSIRTSARRATWITAPTCVNDHSRDKPRLHCHEHTSAAESVFDIRLATEQNNVTLVAPRALVAERRLDLN